MIKKQQNQGNQEEENQIVSVNQGKDQPKYKTTLFKNSFPNNNHEPQQKQQQQSIQSRLLRLILTTFCILVLMIIGFYASIKYSQQNGNTRNFLHKIELIKPLLQQFAQVSSQELHNLIKSNHIKMGDHFQHIQKQKDKINKNRQDTPYQSIQQNYYQTKDSSQNKQEVTKKYFIEFDQQIQTQQTNYFLIHGFTNDQIKHNSMINFQTKAGITKKTFLEALDKLVLPNLFNYKTKSFGIKEQQNQEEVQVQQKKLYQNAKRSQKQKQDTGQNLKSSSLIRSQKDKYGQIYSKQKIESILKMEQQNFNKKYNLQFFNKEPLQFCIIVTGIPQDDQDQQFQGIRTLNSIFMQSYENYHIVYASKPKFYTKIIHQIKQQEFSQQKITLTQWFQQRAYQGHQILITSPIRMQNQNGTTRIGDSNQYQSQIMANNRFRRLPKLFSSNLQSFYVDIFLRIKTQDLKYQNQIFFNHFSSQAIMYPILQMASPQIFYVPQILYEKYQKKNLILNDRSQTFKIERQEFYLKGMYEKLDNYLLSKEQFEKIKYKYQKNLEQENQQLSKGLKQKINQFQQNEQTEQKMQQFDNKAQSQNLVPIQQRQQQIKKRNYDKHTQQDQQNLFKSKNLKNLYQFSHSMKQMIEQGEKQFVFEQQKNITLDQFTQAIQRMWLNHRYNNNGELINSELSNFDRSKIQSNVQVPSKQTIHSISQSQQNYFQQKYQIYNYMKPELQNRFCIVVPSFRNYENNLYLRNLDSIFMQQYSNYHVIYIDDNSPDKTGKYIEEYVEKKGIDKQKIKIIVNQKRQGSMHGIYHGINDHCKNGQIAILLDGDDSFVGKLVLAVLNAVYHKQKVALIYTQHIQVINNFKTFVGISMPFAKQNFIQNSFRSVQEPKSSHLKSFYVDLFKRIRIQDLTYNGQLFYQAASDTAIMKPMLQMSNPRIKYLPQILYQYRYDTGISGDLVHKKQQGYVKKIISKGRKYKPLQEFPFIKEAEQY